MKKLKGVLGVTGPLWDLKATLLHIMNCKWVVWTALHCIHLGQTLKVKHQ